MTATATTDLALQQHPLSAAFPSMPEQELAALALDIEQHGQREPGVMFEGMVLDGWHRYLACDRAGVTFKAVEFDGDDPVAFVISRNLHRRHLTASQRAAAVVATANWKPLGTNQHGGSAPGAYPPAHSEKDMARAAEVSERTIRQAKAAVTADPALGEAMKDGKVSAKTAAEVAKLPKAKRARAVEAIRAGGEPALPKKPTADAEKLRGELIELQGKYADLVEKNTELADTAREATDRLMMFETTEPDEQQKLIADLQKKLVRKDAEIERLTLERSRLNDKCNQLVKQVRMLEKKAK